MKLKVTYLFRLEPNSLYRAACLQTANGFSVLSIIWVGVELMQITTQRTRPAWPAKTKLRMTLNCWRIAKKSRWWVEFLLRAGGTHCFLLASDKYKKDHKKLRRKLIDHCLKLTVRSNWVITSSEPWNTETNKVDRNAPITSKHAFPKRFAKMTDGTEKPKIPSKFAKRAARYKELGYNSNPR